jgi:glycosyltransferase involved in cell wall biosynthesis
MAATDIARYEWRMDRGPGSVLIVCTASDIGGMQRVVCGLARELTRAGWRVRTVFPTSDHDAELLTWCRSQGVDAEVHDAVRDAAAPHSWSSASALRRLVADEHPDVVNVHYGDNFLSIWDVVGVRRARRALVVSIHHPTPWSAASWRKRLMTGLGGRAARAMATFSSATLEVLRATPLPARRIHLIPCGIEIPAELPTRQQARRELGVGDDEIVVGSLGRLVPHKGFDVLIDAMDCEELAGTRLLVAGDGPLRSDLDDRITSTSHLRARLLGHVADEHVLYAASDVFALPSRLEGFGLVYVEAAVHGVPSVATRVGGIPDAVVDGETGVLVAVDDVEAVRAALIELCTQPDVRRRLGERAKERARTELDEATMARRYATLFDQVRPRG